MVRSTLIVSLLAGLNSALSFVGQLVIARFFGASIELDAYFVAISTPLTAAGLFAGVLGYQVVPALRRAENVRGSFHGALVGMIVVLGAGAAAVSTVAIGLGSEIIPDIPSDIRATSAGRTMQLAAAVAWGWVPLAVVGAVITGALYVREKFVAATALQALPMLGALVGCLFFHHTTGTLSIALGQLAGYATMVIALFCCYRLPLTAPDWFAAKDLVQQSPFALGALLIFVIYPLSDAVWGADLGASSVSLLGYSQRLIVGFSGLAIVGVTTVIFPRLARHAAAREDLSFRDEISRSLRIMIGVMAPAAAVFGILAYPTVQLLFVRGAFRETDAIELASILPWMGVGMVAMSGMTLAFKGLFAQFKTRRAATLGLGGALTYFVLSGIFSRHFGLTGIGLAYLVSWWGVFVISVAGMRVFRRTDWRSAASIACITTATGAIAWLARELFLNGTEHGFAAFSRIAIVTGVAGLVFTFGSLIWPGLPDLKLLVTRAKRVTGNGSR
jgi:putative peptidoglycan lipid II flippase